MTDQEKERLIAQLFKQLPNRARPRAIARALGASFIWSETPQGGLYWAEVHESLITLKLSERRAVDWDIVFTPDIKE